jgi:hypothetical protein
MRNFMTIARSLCLALGLYTSALALSDSAFAYNEALALKYQRIVAQEICKEAGWLRCYQLDPATCGTIFPAHVEQCVQTHLSDRGVAAKDKNDIEALSSNIASCIHTSFTQKYKDSKVNNEDCKDIH